MEKIKKYWREISFVTTLLILLSVSTCSHNQQLRLEGEKEQLQIQLDGVKVDIEKAEKESKKLFDSISLVDYLKNKRIVELEKSNRDLVENAKNRKKELKKQKEKIAKYTYLQSAEVLKERYQTDAVKATQTSVNLEDNIPNLVVEELAEKDNMALDLDDNVKTIENKNEQIRLEQEKTLSANLKTASVQVEKELLKEGLNLAEDINKKSKKQIKALKTKNFINKVLIVGGIVGGFIVGNQLAK